MVGKINMDEKTSLIAIVKLSAIIDVFNGILFAVGDDDYMKSIITEYIENIDALMKSIGEEISEKSSKQ